MAKLMIVGWNGQKPHSARYVTVKGKVTRATIMGDFELYRKIVNEMYGKAGAVWDVSPTNKSPVLVCTWFRDAYGNETIRKTVQYD